MAHKRQQHSPTVTHLITSKPARKGAPKRHVKSAAHASAEEKAAHSGGNAAHPRAKSVVSPNGSHAPKEMHTVKGPLKTREASKAKELPKGKDSHAGREHS